ncbi:hypothetical protein F5Y09DRAFT_323925 [Xylaria sp. FL1042]|nr:hypothetical protein F5Y09DRAFT_323925 [Xylaria sp. FL1042]
MTSSKMQALNAAERVPTTSSSKQESSSHSSEISTQPVTPELSQATDWGSFGQPTPNTSPESVINAPSHRKKTSVCLGGSSDISLVTTSTVSRTPSTEEIADTTNTGHCSRYLIHREPSEEIEDNSDHSSHCSTNSGVSEEASITSCPDQKKSFSLIVPIYTSLINLLNLAGQRNSRADNARVQDTIRLIKSLPTIRRTRVTNPTRKLTPSQYEQLLERIQDNKESLDKLRFEYTHSTQQFEIRMVTSLHEGIVGELNRQFILWQAKLGESKNRDVSRAVKTLRQYGNEDIEFPTPKGASDLKSPDGGIKHDCSLVCRPALVFEIEFSHNTKEELRERAEAYILQSNGEIRTVIGVYMGEMYKAERKNERRLKKMYRTGETDESGPQSYPTDERNITGEASILVWQGEIQENNTVAIKRVQEKKFRHKNGNAIQSAALCISLEDCVCKGVEDLVRKHKTPLLEVSSEDLCNVVEKDLRYYRTKRAKVIKEQMQKEKEEKRIKEERAIRREEERLRRATEVRMHDDAGVWGRVIEQGKLFSARIRNRRFPRELG